MDKAHEIEALQARMHLSRKPERLQTDFSETEGTALRGCGVENDGARSKLDELVEAKKRKASQERVGDALYFAAMDRKATKTLEAAANAGPMKRKTQRMVDSLSAHLAAKQEELRRSAEARGFLIREKSGELSYDAGCSDRDNRPAETLVKYAVRKHGPKR